MQVIRRHLQITRVLPDANWNHDHAAYREGAAEVCGPRCGLIELGSKSNTKTQLLLDKLADPAMYVVVNIASDYLNLSIQKLTSR